MVGRGIREVVGGVGLVVVVGELGDRGDRVLVSGFGDRGDPSKHMRISSNRITMIRWGEKEH